jgi:hypothetical protein
MTKRLERKMEWVLIVAVLGSLVALVGLHVWSMERRDMLYRCSSEVQVIDNVPAARRYLDGYLRQLERAELQRGSAALFASGAKDDLALWYGRLRDKRRALAEVEGLADPAAHVIALRSFRDVACSHPRWARLYPYQRAFAVLAVWLLLLVCLCMLVGRRKFQASLRSDPPA